VAPFDLPPDQLAHYAPEVPEPADFDAFWHGTLKEARASAPILDVRPVPNGLRLVESWDVTFAGFGADPIRAWYTRPAGVRKWTKRMLIDGIRWRIRVGAPWRDIPARYGPWPTVYWPCAPRAAPARCSRRARTW